jgi:hypothetical protein
MHRPVAWALNFLHLPCDSLRFVHLCTSTIPFRCTFRTQVQTLVPDCRSSGDTSPTHCEAFSMPASTITCSGASIHSTTSWERIPRPEHRQQFNRHQSKPARTGNMHIVHCTRPSCCRCTRKHEQACMPSQTTHLSTVRLAMAQISKQLLEFSLCLMSRE